MSESNTRKRNLPSWMSSRKEENDDSENSKQQRNPGNSNKDQNPFNGGDKSEEKFASGSSDLSKLMEGIVFVLSGFVNPERGVLRSQMLEMGADYQPDWNSNCTLLVCAFTNTPKFRQVKADGGTVVSKDWISECYNQRKLVDIESYLLHAGKPWKRQSISHEAREDVKPSSKSLKKAEKGSPSKKITASSKMKSCLSPSKAKKWAVEDLKRTISWLESQDEKPEPGEIKKIAAEGILTCLQDAIDALKQEQGMQKVAEQWACLPRVVEELAKFDGNINSSDSLGKVDLCKEAMACKQIYELEFLNVEHDDVLTKKKQQGHGNKKLHKEENVGTDETCYDSDATIEMTEEEIDRAYNTVASSL